MSTNKTIYKTKRAAKEYGKWGCNLYNGCTHGCTYCYCKRGVFKNVLGVDKPVIKSTLGGSPENAYEIFCNELEQHREEIIKDGDGLFFSFSTDPLLKEEAELTFKCLEKCFLNNVRVQLLTKTTWWAKDKHVLSKFKEWNRLYVYPLTVGITLTGHDELETGAPTNEERIEAVKTLQELHIPHFISLEPVVDFESSLMMLKETVEYCDEFRIGLMSPVGKQKYQFDDCIDFIYKVDREEMRISLERHELIRIRWKDSVRKFIESHLKEWLVIDVLNYQVLFTDDSLKECVKFRDSVRNTSWEAIARDSYLDII